MRYERTMNCALFFEQYRTNIERFERYKKLNFARLNKAEPNTKKNKRPTSYQHALQKLKEQNRENDYIITKGDSVAMQNVRFWVIRDYYAALEQILKDKDRAEQAQKNTKK